MMATAFFDGVFVGIMLSVVCYCWYRWSQRKLREAERRGAKEAMRKMGML